MLLPFSCSPLGALPPLTQPQHKEAEVMALWGPSSTTTAPGSNRAIVHQMYNMLIGYYQPDRPHKVQLAGRTHACTHKYTNKHIHPPNCLSVGKITQTRTECEGRAVSRSFLSKVGPKNVDNQSSKQSLLPPSNSANHLSVTRESPPTLQRARSGGSAR